MELSQTLSEWYKSTVLSGPNPGISIKKSEHTLTLPGRQSWEAFAIKFKEQLSYLYSITGCQCYSHGQAHCHNNLLPNWVATLPKAMERLTSLTT